MLSILSASFSNSNKNDIESNLPNIQKLVIHMLDYRYLKTEKLPKQQIDRVEYMCLNVITQFVPKLSESTFRSFFYKVRKVRTFRLSVILILIYLALRLGNSLQRRQQTTSPNNLLPLDQRLS